MNTKQLQKTFAHVYEQFYAQHKIIFSAPFVFSRVWETSASSSWVSIKQKLPLRMYIGIRIQDASPLNNPWYNPSGKLHRWDIIVYNVHEKQFITTPIQEYLLYMTPLDGFIKQHMQGYTDCEYTISLLSELPNTVWMWFDSLFSLLLATVLGKATWTIKNTENLWDNLLGSWLPADSGAQKNKKDADQKDYVTAINDQKTPLYNLLRLAHAVESQILDAHHLDGAIASSLIAWSTPIVSFHEDIYAPKKNSTQKWLFLMHDYKYFVLPISKLYPKEVYNPHLPIDFGVLYSGRPLVLENRYQNNMQKDFHNIMDTIQTTLKPYVSITSGKRKPKFYTDLITTHIKRWTNVVESMSGYMSLAMVQNLTTISKRWYSEDDIKNTIQTLSKTRHIYNILSKPSNHLVRFIDSIYQEIGFRTEQMWVCYNDINSMWGSLVFATPTEWIRNDMTQILFALQRLIPGVELLYASRRDGFEENGLVCEQDLFIQKPSKFIHSNLLMLEVLNGQGGTHFGTYEQLVTHMDVDIVLDTINMKIYAYGQKVTSKELHSQSGTIEMLLTTLQHLGDDVSNKQLPVSSYSKSKNDMVWKIILPLTRLIKEKLNKELPIECFGGMYEYYLRVKKSNVRFGVMKRVQEV